MLIVFGILAGAVILWSWGRPRADIVAVLIVLGLMLSRVLTPQESLAGFGDPSVILIAAVFVVGAALESTGIVNRMSLALLKLGRGSETRLIVLIMLLVGGITAFMSSTAATAMFIPVILAISGRTGLNRKRMLLPPATALNKTGITTMIAHGLVTALGSAGPTAMLMIVFLAAALAGLFLSNAATTLLIAPVAIEAAQALGVSPIAFAMTVVIACSASFVTPVSSTWNPLVMEPGGYSFGDYVKIGLPLLVLTMLITVILVKLIYHF